MRFESAGDLYDIEITGNHISDMGINGIGVVRFFNLVKGGDMVGVHGLHITDNFITRCMRRDLAQVSAAMQFLVGYGGIALAKVSDLRILRNEIVNNGVSHLQPICGVFAIFVQGLQLDDNRIVDNGPRSDGSHKQRPERTAWRSAHLAHSASNRASDWLEYRPGEYQPAFGTQRNSSCSMRDNIIVAPLGRAVTFFALGPVVLARNRLMTQGTTGRGLDLIAATVLIGNFGLSNEWTLGLLVMIVLLLLKQAGGVPAARFCSLAKSLGLINPGPPPVLWPPLVSPLGYGEDTGRRKPDHSRRQSTIRSPLASARS